MFRHGMLDQARERARDLNQKGALFPWRTISGEEASAYYAAGTAQYHINAAIAYAHREVRRGHRRPGVPPRVRRRDPRRDRAALVRPRLLLRPAGRQVLHPQRDRARRVHHRRQQQHLHQPDGPGEPLVRRRRRSTRLREEHPQRVQRARPPHQARARRGRRVAAGRRQHVRPLRRADADQPAGRQLPRPGGVGPQEHAARTSSRCCCTTTRWSSTATR